MYLAKWGNISSVGSTATIALRNLQRSNKYSRINLDSVVFYQVKKVAKKAKIVVE